MTENPTQSAPPQGPSFLDDTFARLRTLQDRQGCHLIFGHDPEQWATLRHAPEPLH